jgi:hypothetical protein
MVDVTTSSWLRARIALAASAAAVTLSATVTGFGGPASPPLQPAGSRAAAVAVSSGSGPRTSASPGPGTPGANAPAGYQRVGGATAGLSLAVPSSWVAVNLARQTPQEAIRQIGLHGVSQATLAQTLRALSKLHAVYAIDVRSIADSSAHFATNMNGYCTDSGLSESGRASVTLLRKLAAAALQRLGAQNIAQTDVVMGGVPGVQTSYTLSAPAVGTVHAAQLEVLPRPGRGCFITLTTAGQVPRAVMAELARSVQYA